MAQAYWEVQSYSEDVVHTQLKTGLQCIEIVMATA